MVKAKDDEELAVAIQNISGAAKGLIYVFEPPISDDSTSTSILKTLDLLARLIGNNTAIVNKRKITCTAISFVNEQLNVANNAGCEDEYGKDYLGSLGKFYRERDLNTYMVLELKARTKMVEALDKEKVKALYKYTLDDLYNFGYATNPSYEDPFIKLCDPIYQELDKFKKARDVIIQTWQKKNEKLKREVQKLQNNENRDIKLGELDQECLMKLLPIFQEIILNPEFKDGISAIKPEAGLERNKAQFKLWMREFLQPLADVQQITQSILLRNNPELESILGATIAPDGSVKSEAVKYLARTEGNTVKDIHAEMRLVDYHGASSETIPIGNSKLACLCCWIAFTKTNGRFSCTGAHQHTFSNWACPKNVTTGEMISALRSINIDDSNRKEALFSMETGAPKNCLEINSAPFSQHIIKFDQATNQAGAEDDSIKDAAKYLYKKHKSFGVKKYLCTYNGEKINIEQETPKKANGEVETKEFDEFSEIKVVGHSDRDGEKSTIGGLSAEDLAKVIKSKAKTNTIGRISLVSCGQDFEDKKGVNQQYAKDLLVALYDRGITETSVSIREKLIRVDSDGHIQYSSDAAIWNYRNSQEKKVYKLTKNGITEDITSTVPSHKEVNLAKTSGQLGIRRALAKTEAVVQSQAYKDTIEKIQSANDLGLEWIPSIQNLEESDVLGGKVQFINSDDSNTNTNNHWISVDDTDFNTLKEFKAYFNKNLNILPVEFNVEDQDIVKINEIDSPGGLSEAIAVKMIFDILNNPTSNDYNPTLATAIEVQTYLNLAQIGLDISRDIYKVVDIVKVLQSEIINGSSEIFSKFSSTLSRTGSGIDIGLNVANIVFDVIEIANAQTPQQKIVFGTQLGFDIASVSLGATSMALSSIGAVTASTIVGSLAVPLVGLTIGFTAFAQAAVQAQGEAITMATYFWQYDQDYNSVGKLLMHIEGGNTALPLAFNLENNQPKQYNQAVIKRIDLTDRRNIKLTLGSQFVYKTINAEKSDAIRHFYVSIFSGGIYSDHTQNNKDRAVPIREYLGHASSIERKYDVGDYEIILPVTPTCYIGYSYNYTPGITTRHDNVLDSARAIQANSRNFLFEYLTFVSFEYAIRNMTFEYVNTKIEILIGDNIGIDNQIFVTPQIPDVYMGKLEYSFKGSSYAKCLLVIMHGAYYVISTGNVTEWVIEASGSEFGGDNAPGIDGTTINIDGVGIRFDSPYPKTILIKKNAVTYVVDVSKGSIVPISIDESTVGSNVTEAIKGIINSTHFNGAYIKIEHHKLENGLTVAAWYDVENDRFLYFTPPEDQSENFPPDPNEVQLLGAIKEQIYYFSDATKSVWYQPQAGALSRKVSSYILNAFINQEYVVAAHNIGVNLLLQVDQDITKSFLVEIKPSSELANIPDEKEVISEIKIIAENYGWIIGSVVQFEKINNLCRWYVFALSKIVEVTTELVSLSLVGWQKNSNNQYIYFLYDDVNKKLYQQINEIGVLDTVEISNLYTVSIIENQVAAITNSGLIFGIGESQNLYLMGLTEPWFTKNQKQELENVLNDLILAYPNHTDTLFLSNKSQTGYYDTTKKILLVCSADKKWVGYDSKKQRIYFLVSGSIESKEYRLCYNGVDSDNVRNYQIDNSMQNIAWFVQITPTPLVEVTIPFSLRDAYFSNALLVIVDQEGAVFNLIETNDLVFQLNLIGINEDWVKTHRNSLVQDLDKLCDHCSDQCSYVLSISYPDGSKGWYNYMYQKVIHPKQSNNSQDISLVYAGFDPENQKNYLFSQVRKKLLAVREDGFTEEIMDLQDFQRFDDTIRLQGSVTNDVFEAVPLFSEAEKLMISGSSGQNRYIINKKLLEHYSVIVIDVLANNQDINTVELSESLFDEFAIHELGRDIILESTQTDFHAAKIVITGSSNSVMLKFKNWQPIELSGKELNLFIGVESYRNLISASSKRLVKFTLANEDDSRTFKDLSYSIDSSQMSIDAAQKTLGSLAPGQSCSFEVEYTAPSLVDKKAEYFSLISIKDRSSDYTKTQEIRFDVYPDFYPLPQEESDPSRHILSENIQTIKVSSHNVLYIGTDKSLSISPDYGKTFEQRTIHNGLASNNIKSIYLDYENVLYVLTEQGLSFSKDGGSTFTTRTINHGLGSNNIISICVINYETQKKIYVGTTQGLSISTDGGNRFITKTTVDKLKSNIVNAISVDSDYRVFVGTEQGLSILDKFDKVITVGQNDRLFTICPELYSQKITVIAANQHKQNSIIIGTTEKLFLVPFFYNDPAYAYDNVPIGVSSIVWNNFGRFYLLNNREQPQYVRGVYVYDTLVNTARVYYLEQSQDIKCCSSVYATDTGDCIWGGSQDGRLLSKIFKGNPNDFSSSWDIQKIVPDLYKSEVVCISPYIRKNERGVYVVGRNFLLFSCRNNSSLFVKQYFPTDTGEIKLLVTNYNTKTDQGVICIATSLGWVSTSMDDGVSFTASSIKTADNQDLKNFTNNLRINAMATSTSNIEGNPIVCIGFNCDHLLYSKNLSGLAISRDFGKNFFLINHASINKKDVLSLFVTKHNTIYIGTSSGLFTSKDLGTTLTSTNVGTGKIAAIYVDNKNVVYVADYNCVYTSIDNGNSFQKSFLSPMGQVVAITKNAQGDLYILSSSNLLVSSDNGNSFSTVLQGRVSQCLLSNFKTMYVGTDAGLYAKDDILNRNSVGV